MTEIDSTWGLKEVHHHACPRCAAIEPKPPFCETCGFDLRHGSLLRPKEGSCLYCQKLGPLTDQHVIGDWARKSYPNKEPRLHAIARPKRRIFFQNHEMKEIIERQKTVERYGETVRNVCKDCNSGWMSRTENKIIPIIKEFAEGGWPTLSVDQSVDFSRWASLVTGSIEQHARTLTMKPHHHSALMNGKMPTGFLVSVGQMATSQWGGIWRHIGINLPTGMGGNGESFVNGQLSYFIVERLVVVSFSTVGDRLMELWQFATSDPRTLSSIFGLRTVWPQLSNAPPSRQFTSSDLDTIVTYFLEPHRDPTPLA